MTGAGDTGAGVTGAGDTGCWVAGASVTGGAIGAPVSGAGGAGASAERQTSESVSMQMGFNNSSVSKKDMNSQNSEVAMFAKLFTVTGLAAPKEMTGPKNRNSVLSMKQFLPNVRVPPALKIRLLEFSEKNSVVP